MNLRRKSHEGAEVSTESLNDIMFFLLLFFLIVSTLVNPNVIKLFLPNAKQDNQMTKQPITLSVTANLEYFVNKVPVPFSQLESKVKDEVDKLDTERTLSEQKYGLKDLQSNPWKLSTSPPTQTCGPRASPSAA